MTKTEAKALLDKAASGAQLTQHEKSLLRKAIAVVSQII
jgi:hypothetical protein